MTYSEAKRLGVRFYHGKPCVDCGGTKRYTKGGCAACARDKGKAVYHRRRQRLDGVEFVYECYSSSDELLYVGRTNHPANRISTHRQESSWWGEVRCTVWTMVPDIERQRIIAKKPKHNKHGM